MKTTDRSTTWKLGGGLAGLALVGVIIIAANIILSKVRLRADLTEENLYTLSDGTVSLLQKLDRPVTLKLFFSSSSTAVPSQLKSYAGQVEDLLWEYRSRAGDHISIEKYDPKPDSDAEEWAQRYGLTGQTVAMFGPPVYFGLVAASGDTEAVIPGFDPSQETLLEYNITRLIYRVTHPEKPVVGVISSLPVLGSQTPPFAMPGQPRPQPQAPWVAVQNLGRDYEMRDLSTSVESIDPDVDALLVIHPKDLGDKTLYAIDQFVLKGGHLLLMLDPLSIADEGSAAASPYAQPQRSSNLQRLLATWGVGYDPAKVVADMNAATSIRMQDNRVERSLVALTLGTNNISRSETLTTQLDAMMLPYAGSLSDNTTEDLTFTPLLYSSDNAGTVNAMMAQYGGQAVQREFKDDPVRLNIAARISGHFRTAFPGGAPVDTGDEAEDAAPPVPVQGLTNGTSTVIVAADVDMIFDPICVEQINVFGFKSHRERNDNLSFFANAVEMTAGSQDLVSVRSRGRSSRPFEKVLELQARAMREWQGREAELEDKLRETERQLRDMQAGKQANQSFILSPEQQEAIQNFKKEELRVKRELKDVRKNLRSDIESLGVTVKTLNIALMPLVVSIAGVTYGLLRRRRETH